MAQLVLESMRSGVSLGEIAKRLSKQSATHFPSWQDTLIHVADLSVKYEE